MSVELTTFQHVLDWSGCALGLFGSCTLATRLPISRYGWVAFFGANIAYIALYGPLGMIGLLCQQIGFLGSSCVGIYRNFFSRSRALADLDDNAIEHMQAWSISAHLAAVPPSYLAGVPEDLARLIEQAQRLHPQMARGALDRALRGEPSGLAI